MSGSAGSQRVRDVLVVGVGNPDRGDDGIGAIVVRQLRARLPSDVRTVVRRGDMLGLIDEWAEFDVVLCVDAAAPAGMPGRMRRFDLRCGTLPRGQAFASSHSLGLAETLGLARALGRAPRDVIVYTIEGSRFDGGTEPGTAVLDAAAALAERIVADVAQRRSTAASPAASDA